MKQHRGVIIPVPAMIHRADPPAVAVVFGGLSYVQGLACRLRRRKGRLRRLGTSTAENACAKQLYISDHPCVIAIHEFGTPHLQTHTT